MTPDELKDKQNDRKFDLIVEFRLMKQKVDDWIENHDNNAFERHNRVEKSLEDIFKKLDLLPCKERKGWYQSISYQVNVLWGFVILIVLAIVVEWVKR